MMRTALAGAILIVGFAAHASDTRTFHVVGAGAGACGTWTADRRTPDGVGSHLDGQWVLGFLSAGGYFAGIDPLRNLDGQAVWAWMDNYCRTNPLVRIIDAAEAFTKEPPR